ncbi:MAG: DoxX family membrane protein [Chitinophagales bacterium]
MDTFNTILRVLLGIVFLVFGANKIVPFLPPPEISGVGADFLSNILGSNFKYVLATFEITCGIMLLLNKYVNLALAILAPIAINILIFHLLIDQDIVNGLPGFFVFFATFWLFWGRKEAFEGILKP